MIDFASDPTILRPRRTPVYVRRCELELLRSAARGRGLVWTGQPHLGALVRPWLHPHITRLARSFPDDWSDEPFAPSPPHPRVQLWIFLDFASRNLVSRYAAFRGVPRTRVLYSWLKPRLEELEPGIRSRVSG